MKNRKLLSILTALTLTASLAACGSTAPESTGTTIRETVEAPAETTEIETTVETEEATETETEAETDAYTADDFGSVTKAYDTEEGENVYTATAYDNTAVSFFESDHTAFATLSGSWEDTSLDVLDITLINDEKGVNETIHYFTDTPESLVENTGFITEDSETWFYKEADHNYYDILFMPEWDESNNTMSYLHPNGLGYYDDILVNGASILDMSELEQILGAPSFMEAEYSGFMDYVWNYKNCVIIIGCDARSINDGIAKPYGIIVTAHHTERWNDYKIIDDYHEWLDTQAETVSE